MKLKFIFLFAMVLLFSTACNESNNNVDDQQVSVEEVSGDKRSSMKEINDYINLDFSDPNYVVIKARQTVTWSLPEPICPAYPITGSKVELHFGLTKVGHNSNYSMDLPCSLEDEFFEGRLTTFLDGFIDKVIADDQNTTMTVAVEYHFPKAAGGKPDIIDYDLSDGRQDYKYDVPEYFNRSGHTQYPGLNTGVYNFEFLRDHKVGSGEKYTVAYTSQSFDPTSMKKVTINSASGGTTDPSNGIVWVMANDQLSITATPDNGYALTQWTGSGGSINFNHSNNPFVFNVGTTDVTVTPVFNLLASTVSGPSSSYYSSAVSYTANAAGFPIGKNRRFVWESSTQVPGSGTWSSWAVTRDITTSSNTDNYSFNMATSHVKQRVTVTSDTYSKTSGDIQTSYYVPSISGNTTLSGSEIGSYSMPGLTGGSYYKWYRRNNASGSFTYVGTGNTTNQSLNGYMLFQLKAEAYNAANQLIFTTTNITVESEE